MGCTTQMMMADPANISLPGTIRKVRPSPHCWTCVVEQAASVDEVGMAWALRWPLAIADVGRWRCAGPFQGEMPLF